LRWSVYRSELPGTHVEGVTPLSALDNMFARTSEGEQRVNLTVTANCNTAGRKRRFSPSTAVAGDGEG
jgi:hypothetical protein